MRIKSIGGWLIGMGAVLLIGCGGGRGDGLPDVPHAVLQQHSYDPQVAFDASGNGAAVWSQFDGLRKNIWARRYIASTAAWSAPVLIETNNGGDADHPQMALDSIGNALVVWEQSDSTRRNIWANRYVVNQGWGTAQLLETDDASFANAPQLALDANGNGMVVWEQSDGTRKSIWARLYNVVTGQWDIASVIESSAEDANAPHITTADANGNFIAVWRGYDGVVHQRYNVWANRYVAGAGWGSASRISNNTTDPAAISDALVSRNADTPHVAMDAAGNALAVWAQDNSIYASRYTVVGAGRGWGAAQLIESDVNWPAAAPRIAMAANGRAYAVWEQSADGVLGDATPPFKNIMANRYVPTLGWQNEVLVETDNAGHAQAPQVVVDGVGNATVVWRQWDVTHYSVWSNRYFIASGQWDTAALIESDNSGDAINPQVAVDAAGNALAVWSQSVGTRSSIRANHSIFGGVWDAALILDGN